MQLSTYLDEKNLSHADFARRLGMTSTSAAMNVWRYATGKRRPRPAIANKIVRITKGRVTLGDI